ncbi:helix-turn-helix transcriptional regulator [Micromonospora craniellae]|uniref:AraC family transcriptional regulator n=1 Tax=Micromonospora craniellae TaxID=2294034 RepID=A0A372FQT1_9ACTN|nr:AraC family transcriptional regulator [Micromonospora craniellae]QOC93204.1 helix-turn-helix transcriptional regulator [Micromonospora craniellae]RFS41005.1 AraC family transcriptional regulator [Micromonospora craniellae]
MDVGQRVTAWRPAVDGIVEVLHATFTMHAYPMHTHGCWTLLVVDDGMIEYDLHRTRHGVLRSQVTLLPPDVAHDGRAASPDGFRKRVLYLDSTILDTGLIGAAVDAPNLTEPTLRRRVHLLHQALRQPGEGFAAQSRFALICEGLSRHLRPTPYVRPEPALARRLRGLLDERAVAGVTLETAARELDASPAHLVRSFTAAYGLAPHAYLTGRRIDEARRLLLRGVPAGQVAASTGFYDQPHLTRHFRRYLGVTPGRYAAGWPSRSTEARV